MVIYIVKTIAVYEMEADSDEEARRMYENGEWDTNMLTDDDGFELGTIDENGEYRVL